MLHDDRSNCALPCPVDFPPKVQRALGRIGGRIGLCAELRKNERLILSELVRAVDHKVPTDSIRIRNATLAAAAGLCERTVGTTKAELVKSGWIRRHQVKSKLRGMQVSDVWMTDKALQALGLDGGAVDNRRGTNPQPQRMRRQSNANAYLFPQSSEKRHQATPGPLNEDQTHGVPLSPSEIALLREMQAMYGEGLEGMDQDEDQPMSKPISSKVPSDLSLLVNLGLSDGAVFRLMGLATASKCRLEHIVAVAGQSIAKARKAYSYVLKLIRAKKDWKRLWSKLPCHEGVDPVEKATGQEEGFSSEAPELLSAEAAARIAPEAHAMIGDRVAVDQDSGEVWWLREGVIDLAPIDIVVLKSGNCNDWGWGGIADRAKALFSPWRATQRGMELYERAMRKMIRGLHDGTLTLCSKVEAIEMARARSNEVSGLQQSLAGDKVVMNEKAGWVWRYSLGRLEQARLKPYVSKAGKSFQWAIQMSAEVERKVARDLAAGRAVIVNEVQALELGGGIAELSREPTAADLAAIQPIQEIRGLFCFA